MEEGNLKMGAVDQHPAMLLLGADPEVAAHGRAVARIAVRIADKLGLGARDREMVAVAAGLHDLGKVPMPDQTLDKPGPLDDEEWAQVRLHPIVGEQLLVSAGFGEIAPWVRHHHERPDGSGYPDHLSGDAIPLQSRIIAVGDAYDAMVSERPYSSALSQSQAREELVRGCGTQFDARIVTAFLQVHLDRPWTRRFRPARVLHAVA
jgi:HD-GYP domain-containing protein (c-di-GMP phosphodiesterase class II)